MNRLIRERGSRAFSARAMTMIEAIASIAVVGLVLVAALEAVSTAQAGEYKIAAHGRGLLLAEDLMAEIVQQAYEDPDSGPVGVVAILESGPAVVAIDAGAGGAGNRGLHNDVDDYKGWSASPPQQKDGTVMSDLQGWQRTAQVVWVDPLDLSNTAGSDQGIKKITVTVTHNNVPVATLFVFRTGAFQVLQEAPGGLATFGGG